MNVKRYFAATAREALRELKAELGADAIVLSNRPGPEGVEILALPAEAVGAINNDDEAVAAEPSASPPLPSSAEEDFRVSLSGTKGERYAPQASSPPGRVIRPFDPPRMETPDYLIRKRGYEEALQGEHDEIGADMVPPLPLSEPSPVVMRSVARRDADAEPSRQRERSAGESAAQRYGLKEEDGGMDSAGAKRLLALEEANARLMNELGSIRDMIERQLASFAWSDTCRNAPGRAEMIGELLEAGFSAVQARRLAEGVAEDATLDEARKVVKSALSRDLRAMSSDADLIDKGGVYALVGPTGVGKTTTTAKIAARCVVRHGAEKIALITTDGYRIGAHEQLRIYGRILGVPMFPVRDAADLRQTIAELSNKHMVLIDTVGMSQRDEMVVQQAAMLTGAGEVRRLLLLNATCGGDTLDDVVRAYRGPDLAGCVLTKVDEAASLAPAVGVAIAHALDVFYVTNGQRVPEDLHLPNRAYLLHRSMKPRKDDSPWKLQSDDAAMMLAAGAGGR